MRALRLPARGPQPCGKVSTNVTAHVALTSWKQITSQRLASARTSSINFTEKGAAFSRLMNASAAHAPTL